MTEHEAASRPQGVGKNLAVVFLIVLVIGGGWGWWQIQTQGQNLDDTQGALQLQVLTSRLGAAAIQAEYGNYDEAREIMSGVYDGIQNRGIEQGSLPENFAQVLQTRDQVITALARQQPEVTNRLVELFFRLQIPVDTELSPEHIIPAADSGIGMEPPTRRTMDTMRPPPPDTSDMPRESIEVPADTSGVTAIPPDTSGG